MGDGARCLASPYFSEDYHEDARVAVCSDGYREGSTTRRIVAKAANFEQ